MSARHFLPGGYPNPDPCYISPEEEAAMCDGPPDWDEPEEPVNEDAALAAIVMLAMER